MQNLKLTIFLLSLFLVASVANAVDFTFSGHDFIKARSIEIAEEVFHPTLENLESEQVKFNIIGIEGTMPETNWYWYFCAGGTCFPGDSGFVFVDPGATEEVELHFGPGGFNGAGDVTLKVYPEGYPDEAQYLKFTYMAEPVIILVDDDGGDDYENYYTSALDNLFGMSYGVWDRSIEGFDDEDLHYCSQLFWETGTTTENTLTSEDQAALIDFMDNMHGQLFISGEGIGSDIGTTDFYHDYLGVTLANEDTDQYHLTGLTGSSIGDGFDFNISGGDGADNQTKPEAVNCGENTWGVFEYDSGELGAVMHIKPLPDNTAAASVYFAFGFEAIDNADDRNQIVQKIFYWLLGATSGVQDQDIAYVPAKSQLHQNYPNPFNPVTHIDFEIANSAFVKLDIYNSAGQLVKNLINDNKATATYSVVWNGTDQLGENVESGIYYYTLNITEGTKTKSTTQKMLLLK